MADEIAQDVSPDELVLDLGSTGLQRTGGWVQEEWHKRLRGSRGARAYREMRDNDAIVGGTRNAINNLIIQADWFIKAATDSNNISDQAQVEAAEFVEGAFEDMAHSMTDLLGEALTMLDFGWCYLEEVYKRREGENGATPSEFDDGRWGWARLPIRAQDSLERWEFDEDGNILGMWQWTMEKGSVFIPMSKALHFRTTAHLNNPEGRSLYRNGYISYWYAKNLRSIEAIGIERELAGYPVMRIPGKLLRRNVTGDDATSLAQYKKHIQGIRRDEREGSLLPSERDEAGNFKYTLELLSSGGKRSIDPSTVIVRYEQRMAMSMLSEFLLLGMDKHGSFALASEKTSMFALAVGGWMNRIAEVFNRKAIPRLMRLNGFPRETWPTLEHGDIEDIALETAVKAIVDAVTAGVLTPDESVETEVRQLLGLPELREDRREAPGTTANPNGSAQQGALEDEPPADDDEA